MRSVQETLAARIPLGKRLDLGTPGVGWPGTKTGAQPVCQARVPNLKMAAVVQLSKFKGSNDFSSSLRPLPQGEELQLGELIWVLYQLYLWGCKCPAQEHSRAL